jgi:hypothetical protein
MKELVDILHEVEKEYNLPGSAFDKTMGPLLYMHFKKNDTILHQNMSNLYIRVCSPAQLLAMKIFAARMSPEYNDLNDALELCKILDINYAVEMKNIVNLYIKEESYENENKKLDRINRSKIFMERLEVMLND